MKNSAGFVSDQHLTYSYDGAGNILSKTDVNGSLSETYAYDERNRLVSSTALNAPERSFTFEYDDFNNITKMVKNSIQKTYEYDDVKVHSLKAVYEGSSYKIYTYNENGDVTLTVSPDAAREVEYNASNCVKSMTLTGTDKNKSWNYSYDSDGERIKKSFTDPETGKVMTTVYWFSDYEETFADDTLKKVSKLYGGYAQRVTEYDVSDEADSKPRTVKSDTLEFVFKDILGSPVCTVTEDGTIKNTFVYEPFGKMLDTANNNGASKSTTLLRSFTGHFAEDDEGLYYCHARWYDADIGRFLQADSVLDGFNRYAYCHNNPIGFTDPSGEYSLREECRRGQKKLKAWNNHLHPERERHGRERHEAMQRGIKSWNEKSKIHGHLLRANESYTTVDGKNKEKRGKDLLIVENPIKGESVMIPVSSVANMEGYGLKDSLAEKDFTLTYDPDCGSKYAPNVFTISSGELCPKNTLQHQGGKLHSDGTIDTNKVPWRGHNTDCWGSQGCITGQEGNPKGDFTDVIKAINSWGISGKYNIPFSFGLGEH